MPHLATIGPHQKVTVHSNPRDVDENPAPLLPGQLGNQAVTWTMSPPNMLGKTTSEEGADATFSHLGLVGVVAVSMDGASDTGVHHQTSFTLECVAGSFDHFSPTADLPVPQ